MVWGIEGPAFAARYRPKTGFTRAVNLANLRAEVGAPLFIGDGAAVVLGRDVNRFALRWRCLRRSRGPPSAAAPCPVKSVVADSFGRQTAALVQSDGRLRCHRCRLPRS